jgi:hypothetical protein
MLKIEKRLTKSTIIRRLLVDSLILGNSSKEQIEAFVDIADAEGHSKIVAVFVVDTFVAASLVVVGYIVAEVVVAVLLPLVANYLN